MSTFDYVALDTAGARVRGRARAQDELALDRELETRRLVLLRARPAAERERGLGLGRTELAGLMTQLGTTLGAGVPLTDGLAGIGRRMRSESGRRVVGDLVASLEAGESLSIAMARHPRAFPTTIVSAVRAGEAAGELPRVLGEIAGHLETSSRLRASAVQALVYPGLLVAAVAALVVLLLTFLLPRVAALYPSGNAGLPAETRFVLGVSGTLVRHGPWLIATLAALSAGLCAASRRPAARVRLHAALLHVPSLGPLARQVATSRFASTASLLHAAGCDVLTTLRLAGEVCGNAALAASFQRAGESVRRGATLTDALERERHIDPLLVQMVEVGERAGELERCLARVAAHYEVEVPRAVQRCVSLLEPTLLIASGCLVAFILLAALLPLFDLYEVLG